jgi:hypothetical protein
VVQCLGKCNQGIGIDDYTIVHVLSHCFLCVVIRLSSSDRNRNSTNTNEHIPTPANVCLYYPFPISRRCLHGLFLSVQSNNKRFDLAGQTVCIKEVNVCTVQVEEDETWFTPECFARVIIIIIIHITISIDDSLHDSFPF